jgi:hypothetical protein
MLEELRIQSCEWAAPERRIRIRGQEGERRIRIRGQEEGERKIQICGHEWWDLLPCPAMPELCEPQELQVLSQIDENVSPKRETYDRERV